MDTVSGSCACLVSGQSAHVLGALGALGALDVNAARAVADDIAVAVGDIVAAIAAHNAVAVGDDGGYWRYQTHLTFASELEKRLMERRSESRIESVKKGLLHCCWGYDDAGSWYYYGRWGLRERMVSGSEGMDCDARSMLCHCRRQPAIPLETMPS